MKKQFVSELGEMAFINRFRKHQGWWREHVLNEEEGEYWDERKRVFKKASNRMKHGKENYKNFLSEEILETVEQAVETQKQKKSGIINEDRLYNNLLSSQPLAFNFFAWFNNDLEVALAFVQTMKPEITGFREVVFETAPENSADHSAFDFGFIVESNIGRGFMGFECKYTDTFSFKRPKTHVYYGDEQDKNYQDYYKIYKSKSERFPDDYLSYVRNPYYNQLFRNELLAVQLKSEFDFIHTGLFCHHDDEKTIKAGTEFQKKIGNRTKDFIFLTYVDYFERMQKINLSWERRELIMLLWARYCGLKLSANINLA